MPELTLASAQAAYQLGLAVLVTYAVAELLWLRRRCGPSAREVRMTILGTVSQGVLMVLVTVLWRPLSVGVAASFGASLVPWSSGQGMGAWVAGFIVYEFFYWLQHFAAHKVRLLWCIHSPHHAPEGMYMYVGLNHSALESTFYFPLFSGLLPALLGIDPLILVAINVVDLLYGSFLHLSDRIVPSGRYGVLGQILQTPSHHRVHHAQNVRYMDMNYNAMTVFWDRLLGTFEPLRQDEPVTFGITRPVDTGSFIDSHLGEFALLWRDVRTARSLGDAVGYILHAPGWKPGDASGTAAALRERLMQMDAASQDEREVVDARHNNEVTAARRG